MEPTKEQYENMGFDNYFEGIDYNQGPTTVHWMNGWIRAERESRCGHFDRYGNHTPCYA